jgi:D-glycero-D-manno-heptose 1,7-bisphosphate phosphatase
MVKCVFYDRDGVLNSLVQRETQPTAPWSIDEFEMLQYSNSATKLTKQYGYMNIVLSNQPDLNDNLLSKEDLDKMDDCLFDNLSIDFIAYAMDRKAEYYKPKNGLVELLINTYCIDRKNSYFVGDRWKDIVCGHESNLTTIFIGPRYECPDEYSHIKPDYVVEDVLQASLVIKMIEEHND